MSATATPPPEHLVYRLTRTGASVASQPQGRVSRGFLRLLSAIDGMRNLAKVQDQVRDLGLSQADLMAWMRELERQEMVEMAVAIRTPGFSYEGFLEVERDEGFERTVEQIRQALKRDQPGADDHLLRTTARLMALESGPTTRAITENGFFALQSRNSGDGGTRPDNFLVLIVEDDALQARVAQNIVSKEGFQTSWAEDGHELVSHLKAPRRPDLILLDVDLQGSEDGFDYLAKIRRHPSFTSTRVIMLTARSEREDIARGVMLGANGYVTKPYRPELLRGAIRQTLNLAAA
ncbi:MAG TPA: response regulator [Burkholderiales bacterium]|jgi:CheY-like chemotaxis protein